MAATTTMIAPITRMMMPMLRSVLVALGAAKLRTGVGVRVFKLPAGRGVLVAGAGLGVKVGVRDGSGVRESTPVTVGLGVKVAVSAGVGVWVLVAVRAGVGLGVAG